MKEKKVIHSVLTGKIFFASVEKKSNGTSVITGQKVEVTESSLNAVAQKLLIDEAEMEFDARGKRYVLKVEEIK